MKVSVLVIGLLGLLVLGAPDLRAQVYGPYYSPYADIQYQQYLQWQQQYLDYWRQNDPYYDLHVMHYQLYLQRYQPFLTYPCCYTFSVPIWSTPARRMPHGPRGREPRPIRRR